MGGSSSHEQRMRSENAEQPWPQLQSTPTSNYERSEAPRLSPTWPSNASPTQTGSEVIPPGVLPSPSTSSVSVLVTLPQQSREKVIPPSQTTSGITPSETNTSTTLPQKPSKADSAEPRSFAAPSNPHSLRTTPGPLSKDHSIPPRINAAKSTITAVPADFHPLQPTSPLVTENVRAAQSGNVIPQKINPVQFATPSAPMPQATSYATTQNARVRPQPQFSPARVVPPKGIPAESELSVVKPKTPQTQAPSKPPNVLPAKNIPPLIPPKAFPEQSQSNRSSHLTPPTKVSLAKTATLTKSQENMSSKDVSSNTQGTKKKEADSDKLKLEALKRMLECPICLEMSSKSMYLCSNGHSICGACREKLEKCPLCQATISQTKNILYEKIIEAFLVKCDYASEGCLEKIPETEREAHKAQCHFRYMQCSFGNSCMNNAKNGVKIKYRNYIKHIRNIHKINFVKSASTKFTQFCSKEGAQLDEDHPWEDCVVEGLEAFGHYFLTGTTIINGAIFWWVYLFGDQKTADTFLSTITLVKRTAGLKISWTGPVHNIRLEPKIIAESGLCLMLNKANFQSFIYTKPTAEGDNTASEERAWDIIFTLRKKEEILACEL